MNNPFEIIEARLSNIESLLISIRSQAVNVPNPADDLLTISQAAELLSLTVPTIYGLVHRHEIPNSKRGKRLYFSKAELLEWVSAGRRRTITESMENPENNFKKLKGRRVKA
jgi:excisionase family DNA binding protein